MRLFNVYLRAIVKIEYGNFSEHFKESNSQIQRYQGIMSRKGAGGRKGSISFAIVVLFVF